MTQLLVLAIALLAAGAGLGWTAAIVWQDSRPGIVATMLVLCIMMYDEALKHAQAALSLSDTEDERRRATDMIESLTKAKGGGVD